MLSAEPAFARALADKLGVDPREHARLGAQATPRYVRVREASPAGGDVAEQLSADLGVPVVQSTVLPDFYAVAEADGLRLAHSPLFRAGEICGLDLASGVAARELGVEKGDHVLDLCCAPGAKLLYLHDLLAGTGSVTGVDISRRRLETCRAVAHKHRLALYRLFLHDGTTFSVPPPTIVAYIRARQAGGEAAARAIAAPRPCRDAEAFVKPFHAPRLLRDDPQTQAGSLYDRVLVDAECTHDGSFIHLEHGRKHWIGDSEQDRVSQCIGRMLDPARLDSLQALQRGLLENGFRMLRPGGTLVYSTCSLSAKQNEEIIRWFLAKEPRARLLPLTYVPSRARARSCSNTDDRLVHEMTARMSPVTTQTSGMFVAKLQKDL